MGQQFEDADYCLSIGRDVDYTKNDAKRLGTKCAEKKCLFYIWNFLVKGKGHLVVKTLMPQHNCGSLARVKKKMRAYWIVST